MLPELCFCQQNETVFHEAMNKSLILIWLTKLLVRSRFSVSQYRALGPPEQQHQQQQLYHYCYMYKFYYNCHHRAPTKELISS